MTRQTSINLTPATEQQADYLRSKGYGTFTEIVRVAIDRMAIQAGYTMSTIRRFTGFDGAIDGAATDDELDAARACGFVNSFREGVFQVIEERSEHLPDGWRLLAGTSTHSYDPQPPENLNAPILMGFVLVHSGDPHFPIWLYHS